MKTEITKNGNEQIITLEGRLDTLTSPALQDAVHATIKKSSKTIIDFTKVDYISSAGLRVLLISEKLAKQREGELIIRNVAESVLDILNMTGFSKILTIE